MGRTGKCINRQIIESLNFGSFCLKKKWLEYLLGFSCLRKRKTRGWSSNPFFKTKVWSWNNVPFCTDFVLITSRFLTHSCSINFKHLTPITPNPLTKNKGLFIFWTVANIKGAIQGHQQRNTDTALLSPTLNYATLERLSPLKIWRKENGSHSRLAKIKLGRARTQIFLSVHMSAMPIIFQLGSSPNPKPKL